MDWFYGISVSDNIYISGVFRDTIVIDSLILICNGTQNVILGCFDLNGHTKWLQQIGSPLAVSSECVFINTDYNVYLTGSYLQSAVFDDTVLYATGSNSDAFIAQYDTSGNFAWVRSMGGVDVDWGQSVAGDNSGNIYGMGTFQSTQAVFGDITINTFTGSDYFICKLDTNGDFLWAKTIRSRAYYIGDRICNSIKCDENDNLYITGSFQDSLVYDGYTYYNAGGYDLFIMKVNPAGNLLWVTTAGNPYGNYSRSLARDNNNNLYITGRFYDQLWFGNNSIASAGNADIFIAKLHEEPVGINPDSKLKIANCKMQIYPNPASDYIIINIPFNKNDFSQLEFYDVNGRCLLKENITYKSGKIKYNIAAWNSGAYLVKYVSGGNISTSVFSKF